MTFAGIHFAKPHVITKHPLSDAQVLSYLFEPAAVKFGDKLEALSFARYGWCATFTTKDNQKKWVVTYLGDGYSKIARLSAHHNLRYHFQNLFQAVSETPSMKATYKEYEKKGLALGSDPLPSQPFVFNAKRIFKYLWQPVATRIVQQFRKQPVSFYFSAENWCARFELEGGLKGAIIYRGKKSYRTIIGVTDAAFELIGRRFNIVEELPS